MTQVDKGKLDLIASPCPLCGGFEAEELWRHSSGIVNGICTACGHVHLSRRYPEHVIAESYQEYGQCYSDEYLADEENPLFKTARNRFDFLNEHSCISQVDSVLEVGCGYGHFLKTIQNANRKIGIEPSTTQASFSRSFFGLDRIIEGTYEASLPLADRGRQLTFDLVCSFHVIEHLIDPVGFIRKVREQLQVDGYLFLAFPNIFTLAPNLVELFYIYKNWHIHSFSPFTIVNLLTKNGFKLLFSKEEQSTAMNPSDYMVLAQRSDASIVEQGNFHVFEENRMAAKRFHRSLDGWLADLRDSFSHWSKSGKRSAIYGGGIHTQALLELAGIDLGSVRAIIDDDPGKIGRVINGIPIIAFSEVTNNNFDVIIVSSLAAENMILERLMSSGLPPSIEIKGVCRDYMDNRGKVD